ncbi:MAG: aminopeptidase P family protein [Thermomicrobiales bacterium]|nr:aminopeptidase P family protein [Thermomicrobiales bacterium]
MGKKPAKKSTKKAAAAAPPVPTPVIGWAIGQAEYDERVAKVRAMLAERKLDALVLFHPIRMAYTTGFFHLSTERPMAIVIGASDKIGALIPWLEQEHIAKSPSVTNVKVYPEYPSGGTKHPLLHFADLLKEMGLTKKGTRLGYDSNGYLDINGYDGPTLTELAGDGVETVSSRDIVDYLRAIKSDAELNFIIHSCVWGNLAHQLMHNKLELGRTALDISLEASTEASRAMLNALGPSYRQLTTTFGQPAGVIFSAGKNTSLPHGLGGGMGLQRGDILVTGSSADIAGYHSELERTMVIGEPNAAFIKHYEQMMALQQAGFDALKPGRTFAEAETEISKLYADLGVPEMQRHHTGHGIGLEGHEWPFIDKGSDYLIEENMVLSVEPGIYAPGVGGFRHSDTIVVRSWGAERLTFYPRDLDSMVVNI